MENLASGTVATFFMIVPTAAFLAVGGAGFPLLLKKEGVDPTAAIESGIIPVLLLLAPIAAYVHGSLHLNVQPLLPRPVDRDKIAGVMVAWSGVNATQGIVLFVAISMWSTGILMQTGLAPALAWLAGLVLALIALQILAHLLRVLLHRTLLGFFGAGAVGLGLLLVDLFSGSPVTAEAGHIFFSGIRNGEVTLPVLLAIATAGLAILARRATRPLLYTDDLTRGARSHHPSRGVLQRLPVILRTDTRLLFRNRRTRVLIFNMLLWPLFGISQMLIGIEDGKTFNLILGAFFLTTGSTAFYMVHAWRFRCEHFDGLLARPISSNALTRSILRLADVSLVIGIAVGILFLGWLAPVYIPLVLALGLYASGVAHAAGAFLSLIPKQPYPPNLSNFDMTGAVIGGGSVMAMLAAGNVAIASLPVVLCVFAPSVTAWYVAAVPAILGLAALAARSTFIGYSSSLYDRRRYTLASSFRGDG